MILLSFFFLQFPFFSYWCKLLLPKIYFFFSIIFICFCFFVFRKFTIVKFLLVFLEYHNHINMLKWMYNINYCHFPKLISFIHLKFIWIRINISITTCFRILLINLNVYIIYMCIIIMCNIELINQICLY